MNPLFRGASAGNLTLCYTSPCIDAGDTLLENPDPNAADTPLVLQDLTDLDENGNTAEQTPREMLYPRARVLTPAGQIDMGAYEVGTCTADVSGNGTVGLEDLAQLLTCFGSSCNLYPYDCSVADLNCDAVVNLTDLATLLAHFGETCLGLTGDGFGENRAMTDPNPLTQWLRSATPEEVLNWWFAGQPPVGDGDR